MNTRFYSGRKNVQAWVDKKPEWHTWFAWYRITYTETYISQPRIAYLPWWYDAWLEKVERRRVMEHDGTGYVESYEYRKRQGKD